MKIDRMSRSTTPELYQSYNELSRIEMYCVKIQGIKFMFPMDWSIH